MQKILLFIVTLCSVALLNATPSFAEPVTLNNATNNKNRPFMEVNGPYEYLYVISATDSEGREINLTTDNLYPEYDGNTWIVYKYTGDITTLNFKTIQYRKLDSDSYEHYTDINWNGLTYTLNLYTSSGTLQPKRTNFTVYKKDKTVFFYRQMNLKEVIPEVQREEKTLVMKLVGSSARSLVVLGIGLVALLITLWLLVRVLRQSLRG